MTSTASIFRSAGADITIERIRDLVAQNLSESLTLEYKEQYTSSLVRSVAAMANSYGGVILVGVTDGAEENRIVGVPESAVVQIASACHDALEPPWEPEIVPVPVSEGLFILVVRVDETRAPRPILMSGAAPIRLNGRNATADRGRLAQLFTETVSTSTVRGRYVSSPQLERTQNGSAGADFLLRAGMMVLVGDAATWRPISERSIEALARALNGSAINGVLLRESPGSGVNPFARHGFNRARHVRLAWQSVVQGTDINPVESIVEARLPRDYGVGSALEVFMDVIVRQNVARAQIGSPLPEPLGRLAPARLRSILLGMLESLTDEFVTSTIADIADVDPVLVPQPASVTLLAGPPITDLLHTAGLHLIEGAGDSNGATLIANPTLDLRAPEERIEQVDMWMVQIALDAGLRGMEGLLDQIRAEEWGRGDSGRGAISRDLDR